MTSEEDRGVSSSAGVHKRKKVRTSRHHTSIATVEQSTVPKVNWVSFLSGLTAGVAQAGLFNPFDRALYLSVKNHTPFLRRENFQTPYQGFFQSVGHRALSGGL